jgi:hypothetical protein
MPPDNDSAVELQFPMPVETFLKHALRDPLSGEIGKIRLATGGFYSHAALIFLVPKPEEGFDNSFVLESISSGVGLANLRDYIDRKRGHSDIVILRLEAPWFNDELRSQVRGLMLDHVKAGYDYGKVFRLGLSFLFGLQLGISRVAKGKRRSMEDAVRRTRKRRSHGVPPQFICSGFVQYGFAEAARRNRLPVRDALFKDGLDPNDWQQILTVTPEDIATSDKLDWLYAITRGKVYRATTYAEAKAIISHAKR